MGARERGEIQRLSPALGGLAEALRAQRIPREERGRSLRFTVRFGFALGEIYGPDRKFGLWGRSGGWHILQGRKDSRWAAVQNAACGADNSRASHADRGLDSLNRAARAAPPIQRCGGAAMAEFGGAACFLPARSAA